MNWTKTSRTVHSDGGSTVRYECDGLMAVESRKRPIPHASRSGYWMHTTYFLIRPDGTEKEYRSLKDAKAAAEKEL